MVDLSLPSVDEVSTVLSSGDGTGGFSVLAAHIYRDSHIIYNSNYHTSKLSSVGIDRFVPAAYPISGIDKSRVLGIKMMRKNM